MEQIQNILKESGEALVNALADKNWDKIIVKVFAISMFIESKGVYIEDNIERSFGVNVKTSSGRPFSIKISELRKLIVST